MTSLDERYAVAAGLAFGARGTAPTCGALRPHWSDDGSHFWYRTRDEAAATVVVVDIEAGLQHKVADQAALDAALGHGATWARHESRPTLDAVDDTFGAHHAVSPDGEAAVSLAGPNLLLHRRDRADAVALTDDGEPEWGYGDYVDAISQVSARLRGTPRRPSVIWSPDAQRFAVLRTDLRRVPLQHLVQAVPAHGVRSVLHSYRYAMPGDAERARHQLWFIGRDGARVQAQIDGLESHFMTPFGLGLARWSADARHFYLVDTSRDATRLTLWRIDTHDGSAARLVEETGPGIVRASPSMAEAPIFQRLADGRLLWWSQRDGWGHLHLIDQQGEARQITRGPWQVRGLLHMDERRRSILFTAGGREPGIDPYLSLAYRVAFDGSGLALLTPELAQHEFIANRPDAAGSNSASPCGRYFVDTFSSVAMPPRSVLRDRDGTVLMTLKGVDAIRFRPTALPEPEPFSVPTLDGAADLWGVLYKPLGFDPAERYPVVEVVYGAPQTAVVPKSWAGNVHGSVAEQLAALGFVTLIIDGPGTPYRSHAFQLAALGHIEACGGLPEHVGAIRRLAGSRPWMDAQRVGIIGGSGGGYAVVRAMGTFPDVYRVGVSFCGNHDQAAYVALWGETYQGLYSDALYAGHESAAVAANITGALLLIHGELDDNVHPAMTLRVVDALIRADRRFDMLLVPNADHRLIEMPYLQRRAWDHLVEKLMGRTAPRPRPRPQETSE